MIDFNYFFLLSCFLFLFLNFVYIYITASSYPKDVRKQSRRPDLLVFAQKNLRGEVCQLLHNPDPAVPSPPDEQNRSTD